MLLFSFRGKSVEHFVYVGNIRGNHIDMFLLAAFCGETVFNGD